MRKKQTNCVRRFSEILVMVIFLTVHIFQGSKLSFAASDRNLPVNNNAETRISFAEFSETEGESIDLRMGQVSNTITDISIPMNGGLDINVMRSFGKRPSRNYGVPGALGNWELEVPMITMNYLGSGKAHCAKPRDVGFSITSPWSVSWIEYQNVDPNKPTSIPRSILLPGLTDIPRTWAGVQLSIPGQPTRELLSKNTTFTPPYVTTDHWKIECISVNGVANSGFKAISPEGVIYEFTSSGYPYTKKIEGVFRTWVDPTGGGHSTTQLKMPNSYWPIHFYATSITDRHNNKQTLTYKLDPNNGLVLDTISMNDQIVNFRYKRIAAYGQSNSDLLRLSNIEANGQMWSYDYNVSGELEYVSMRVKRRSGVGTYSVRVWGYSYVGNAFDGQYLSSNHAIDTITNKYLGEISYVYTNESSKKFGQQFHVPLRVVKTRIARDRQFPQPKSYRTNFNYSYNTIYPAPRLWTENITEVISNDSRKEYRFTAKNFSRQWEQGLISTYRMFALNYDYNNLTTTNAAWDKVNNKPVKTAAKQSVVEFTTYHWTSFATIGENFVKDRPASSVVQRLLGQKTTRHDGAGYTTNYSGYDAYGNPGEIRETGERERRTTYTYNISRSPRILHQVKTESIFGFGPGISRTFFPNGDLQTLTRFTVPTSYTYYPNGEVETITDAELRVQRFANYYRGTAQEKELADGTFEYQAVNPTGTIASETDANGYTTNYLYDLRNRIKLIDYPINNDVNFNYIYPRETVKSRGDRGELLIFTKVDGFGNAIEETKRLTTPSTRGFTNLRIDKQYDQYNRLVFKSHPREVSGYVGLATKGYWTGYDALGRIIVTYNNMTDSVTAYTHAKNKTIEQDAEGNRISYEFKSFGDPANKALSNVQTYTTNASGIKEPTNYIITRDLVDKITSISVGTLKHEFNYDARQYLEYEISPEIGTTVYIRDNVGNVKEKTINNEPSTLYKYTKLNQIRLIDYPDTTPDITTIYNKNGKPKEIGRGDTKLSYAYDENNNLRYERIEVSNKTFVSRYSYSPNDHLNSIEYPGNKVVRYSPDSFGRATQVSPYVTNVSYHPGGTVDTITYANGQNTRFALDSGNRIKSAITMSDSLVTVASKLYEYSLTGDLTKILAPQHNNQIDVLTYDELHRLTSVTSNGLPYYDVSYDLIGNIKTLDNVHRSDSLNKPSVSLAYNYDPATNRLATITGEKPYSFSYDNQGNVSSMGLNKTLTYDLSNNLVKSVIGVNKTFHIYDGNSRLVKTTRNGEDRYIGNSTLGHRYFDFSESKDFIKIHAYLDDIKVASLKITDQRATDTDGDGIDNLYEISHGLNRDSALDASEDIDNDGLTALEEYQAGTNPYKYDTDGDGINDYDEVQQGTVGGPGGGGATPPPGGAPAGRVLTGLQALYIFSAGAGSTVVDQSGIGLPLDLAISGDVSWTVNGLSVNSIGAATSTGGATKLIDAIKLSNEFTVEAWITPASLTQNFLGPVSIVAIQARDTIRNMQLGQDSNVRYRSNIVSSGYNTPWGKFTGTPVNSVKLQLTHVVLTRDTLGNIKIYIDGVESASDLSPGDLSNWDVNYPLVLGSDVSSNVSRPWAGEYHLVGIYSKALTAAEVTQNYTAGQ